MRNAIACILALTIYSTFAQEPSDPSATQDSADPTATITDVTSDISLTNILNTTDFFILSEWQLQLSERMGALNNEIRSLDFRITEAESYEYSSNKLNEATQKLSEIQINIASNNVAATNQSAIDDSYDTYSLKQQIENIKREQQELPQDLQHLKTAQLELHEKQTLFNAVGNRIRQLLPPEQNFKKVISITFACVIGLMIIGFFILAGIDQKMRQAIFSGDAGIQFLTLFSLVIAIILFGITGILEGKELAALLGGLSGYILGRVTQKGK